MNSPPSTAADAEPTSPPRDESAHSMMHQLLIMRIYPSVVDSLLQTFAEKDAQIDAKDANLRNQLLHLRRDPNETKTVVKRETLSPLSRFAAAAPVSTSQSDPHKQSRKQHALLAFLYPELVGNLQHAIAERDALLQEQDAQIKEHEVLSVARYGQFYLTGNRTRENWYYGMNCL